MKRKIFIVLFITASVAFSSCSKFLEQTSQDLIRPITVANYKELLQGEAYFKDFYRNGWFVDVMTDNIEAVDLQYPTTVVNAKAEFYKLPYQWAQDMEDPSATFTDRFFQTVYKNILAANSCLEVISEMEGTEEERAVLKGQALFTRAYGYFILTNLYAPAYNEADDNDLAVPLTLSTTPSLQRYNRATMKEVWDLISADISEAVNLLENDKAPRSVYEINYKAALILASRIFLYKEDYDKAIEYGEKLLLLSSALKNISNITISLNPASTNATFKSFLLVNDNPEIVFTFSRYTSASTEGSYLYYTREITGLSSLSLGASSSGPSSLINSYQTNDRRKNYWFAPPTGAPGVILTYAIYTPTKVNFYEGSRTSQYFRNAEAYLNVAEAYARKASPDNNSAITLLNQLRRNRIGSYTDLTTADFTTQEALISFIWEERRRELCFEEFHRWWDLRRIGQPGFEHTWLGEVYELNEKDPAYILNFPKQEIDFNPELVPNNRPLREPK